MGTYMRDCAGDVLSTRGDRLMIKSASNIIPSPGSKPSHPLLITTPPRVDCNIIWGVIARGRGLQS